MGGITAAIQQQQTQKDKNVQGLMNPEGSLQVDPNFGKLIQQSGKGGSNSSANQTFAPQEPAYKTNSMGFADVQMDGGFASGVDTPEMYNSSPFRQMDMPNPPSSGTMGGKGASTNSATSGQPRMGQPNRYANTIPQWDNASQQLAPAQRGGKGTGG
jgi:hypothetical protein